RLVLSAVPRKTMQGAVVQPVPLLPPSSHAAAGVRGAHCAPLNCKICPLAGFALETPRPCNPVTVRLGYMPLTSPLLAGRAGKVCPPAKVITPVLLMASPPI